MASEPNPRPSASAADASLLERRMTAWVGKSLKIQGHIVSEEDLVEVARRIRESSSRASGIVTLITPGT